jgi:hypothetical protein
MCSPCRFWADFTISTSESEYPRGTGNFSRSHKIHEWPSARKYLPCLGLEIGGDDNGLATTRLSGAKSKFRNLNHGGEGTDDASRMFRVGKPSVRCRLLKAPA